MAERLASLHTYHEAPGSNPGWSNFLKSFSVFINVKLSLGCLGRKILQEKSSLIQVFCDFPVYVKVNVGEVTMLGTAA